jgi:hypothetical protein
MNPQPELSYRTAVLAAERDQRTIELVRLINEHREGVAARRLPLWRRMRRQPASTPATSATARTSVASAPVPCDGTHAHA